MDFVGPPSSEQIATLRGTLERSRSKLVASDKMFGRFKNYNVVFISLEGFQEFAMDLTVLGKPVLPFLNELRSKSIYFKNIYNQTGVGRTADSEFAILNSLHPLERGVVSFRRSGNNFLTIAHKLKEAGYLTVAAHANKPSFWNRGVVHPRYGYEYDWYDKDFKSGLYVLWGIADHLFLMNLPVNFQNCRSHFLIIPFL